MGGGGAGGVAGRPPMFTSGGPRTARGATATNGDGNGPRPMTSVRAAGFSTSRKASQSAAPGASFDPFNQACEYIDDHLKNAAIQILKNTTALFSAIFS